MYKIDLHTHSVASPDGSLKEADYRIMLQTGTLDYIAVTDHNTISFAQDLRQKLGDKIIVGEEITTLDGEIVGLYLTKVVKAGMSAAQTIADIKKQGGLVYIPHPFETVRKGVSFFTLNAIAQQVDIIETGNGRAVFQNKSKQAEAWAAEHQTPRAASSDAHGRHGWGRTYSILNATPSPATLPALLAKATYRIGSPGLRGVLYPKLNRIRRRRRHV
jgi:predicted metal-dependent phosphoesterase TrpH